MPTAVRMIHEEVDEISFKMCNGVIAVLLVRHQAIFTEHYGIP